MEIRFSRAALILVCFFMFYSCGSNTEEYKLEGAISEVVTKFPQLPKSKEKLSEHYQLVRSVRNGYHNFEIQLRSEPDSIEDPQQILILINKEGKYHAIPFFSNTYRDYWNFPFDNLVPDVKRVNTTFEREFISTLDYLNLNDRIVWDGHAVIEELMFSLLHCKRIELEKDSTKLHIPHFKDNYKIPADNYDSTRVRLKNNYEAISKVMRKDNFTIFWDYFLDEENDRIYELIDKNRFAPKNTDYSIKAYRLEQITHTPRM